MHACTMHLYIKHAGLAFDATCTYMYVCMHYTYGFRLIFDKNIMELYLNTAACSHHAAWCCG